MNRPEHNPDNCRRCVPISANALVSLENWYRLTGQAPGPLLLQDGTQQREAPATPKAKGKGRG